MGAVDKFSFETIEGLAKLLGDCGSGSDISRTLEIVGIQDNSGESTKWRRLNHIFNEVQARDSCANRIVSFIQSFLSPSRYVSRAKEFEERRQSLNVLLAFEGLEFGEDGQFRHRKVAKTLSDAEKRLNAIRNKFQGRVLHMEVLKYCRKELLEDNYFHAVFEATKGLAQRIRELSGIELDGANLVDKVFSIEEPILALNTLQTVTEKSEHKGFALLLKGCFGAVRNPLAHGPKILWNGEDDAADYLSLISLLHRKLDNCVKTGNC